MEIEVVYDTNGKDFQDIIDQFLIHYYHEQTINNSNKHKKEVK